MSGFLQQCAESQERSPSDFRLATRSVVVRLKGGLGNQILALLSAQVGKFIGASECNNEKHA